MPSPSDDGSALEARIVALLASGDQEAAATEVIQALGPAVHRFLGALLGDWALADDAYALFCEWTWRSLPTYRERSRLRIWCFGVAVNAARRVREEPWRRRAQVFSTEGMARLVAQRTSTSVADRERLWSGLDAVRAELGEDDRHLLVLRLEERLSWLEIEEVLRDGEAAASAAALRKRFERLKDRLGTLLRERGLLA